MSDIDIDDERKKLGWVKASNYIILDGIELDESEKAFLNLPMDFREVGNISNTISFLNMRSTSLSSNPRVYEPRIKEVGYFGYY